MQSFQRSLSQLIYRLCFVYKLHRVAAQFTYSESANMTNLLWEELTKPDSGVRMLIQSKRVTVRNYWWSMRREDLKICNYTSSINDESQSRIYSKEEGNGNTFYTVNWKGTAQNQNHLSAWIDTHTIAVASHSLEGKQASCHGLYTDLDWQILLRAWIIFRYFSVIPYSKLFVSVLLPHCNHYNPHLN